MSRCKHEDAEQSRQLDDWWWCPSCKTHLKKKEVTQVRFAEEKH